MTPKQLIKKWNRFVRGLPELTGDEIYSCKKCKHSFTLLESKGEIDAFGYSVECPKCKAYVKFEPLGYSKNE